MVAVGSSAMKRPRDDRQALVAPNVTIEPRWGTECPSPIPIGDRSALRCIVAQWPSATFLRRYDGHQLAKKRTESWVHRMVALSGVLDELIDSGVVDVTDLALVTRATSRSVSRWTAAQAAPRRDAEDRLLELKAVVDQVRRVVRDEPARLWLRSPNPDLDWRKPLELLAEGQYRRVIGSVLAMAEGVTA
jgi:hypothetical protein